MSGLPKRSRISVNRRATLSGSETSQKANAAADQAAYRPIAYTNANKQGPALIVLPGDIKSNNATFLQKFTANNIADFGELELSNANFKVLERSNLGPVLREFEIAYNLGDPQAARKYLGMGKMKTTKYVVMAATSHGRELRKFGHMPVVDGYGTSQ